MRPWILRALAALTAVGLAATLAEAGPQARLRGKVVDGTGAPVANATVVITTQESESFRKVVEVASDGTFTAVLLDATRPYVFHVEAPGYLPHEEPFKVPAGSTENEFTLTLTPVEKAGAKGGAETAAQPGYSELGEARSLLTQGKKAEARDALHRAVAADPELLLGWSSLAELEMDMGDAKAALASATRCLELDSESLRCLAVAANAAAALGLADEHRGFVERYQKLKPDDPAALFNQAAELLNRMDDEGARPLLERCLESDPDFSQCIFQYGMLLLRAGDLEGAKKQLQHYLEVAPEGADAATARETLKYL